MRWHALAWLGGFAVVVALGAAATVTNERVEHAQSPGDCSCHQASAFEDHTPGFIEVDHGSAARRDRQRCVGCHSDERADCQDCHDEAQPEWHGKSMAVPQREPGARRAHSEAVFEHANACAECHRSRFQSSCAHCHRPDESWLRGGP